MIKVKVFFRYYYVIVIIVVVLGLFFMLFKNNSRTVETEVEVVKYDNKVIVLDKAPSNELLFNIVGTTSLEQSLPSELSYTRINEIKLQAFLKTRNSLLTDEPYFSTITTVAKDFDIHPLFLFAILGQEQGFVPRDNVYALSIVNNPFNVFGSWKAYNTNIKDAAEIAARSIIHLSADRPNQEDPIKWINLRGGEGGYAEDETWWIGVKELFARLKKETQ